MSKDNMTRHTTTTRTGGSGGAHYACCGSEGEVDGAARLSAGHTHSHVAQELREQQVLPWPRTHAEHMLQRSKPMVQDKLDTNLVGETCCSSCAATSPKEVSTHGNCVKF